MKYLNSRPSYYYFRFLKTDVCHIEFYFWFRFWPIPGHGQLGMAFCIGVPNVINIGKRTTEL